MNFGHSQNTFAVDVALHGEIDASAVPPAGDDDRTLKLKRQHFFKDTRHVPQFGPGFCQLRSGFDPDLPFSVVTHAGGFQDAGQQIVVNREQICLVFDHRVGGTGHAAAVEMGLFGTPVLGYTHGICTGRYRTALRQGFQGFGRNVFKLGGDRMTARGQRGQATGLKISCLHMVVADPTGRAMDIRVEHRRFKPHGLRSMHKHAPQLATPHHP